MKHVLHALLFTFKEILTVKVIRLSLSIGFVVTLVWGFVGYLYWSKLIAFSSYILELIPFSMLESNGALVLSIFFWFILILVTFAIIFAFLGNFIAGKTSKNMANIYALLIIAASAVFWTIIWINKSTYIHTELVKLMSWLPFKTLDEGISFILGIYVVYMAIVMSMILIASLMNGYFIKSVLNDKIVKNREIKTIQYTLRDMVIFLVASILVVPLLFVPLLNVIIQIGLWSWLMKDTFVYDNLSLLSETVVSKEQLKQHRGAFWSISIFCALFNLIPIINFIGPFFGELAVYRYIEEQKQQQKI